MKNDFRKWGAGVKDIPVNEPSLDDVSDEGESEIEQTYRRLIQNEIEFILSNRNNHHQKMRVGNDKPQSNNELPT